MRTKEEILEAIRQYNIELQCLAQELIDVTAEIWLAVYDVCDDNNCVIIALPPKEWVKTDVFGLDCYFDKRMNSVQTFFSEKDEHDEETGSSGRSVYPNQGSVPFFDGNVLMRAFTVRCQAEACLDYWRWTAGTCEYEQ